MLLGTSARGRGGGSTRARPVALAALVVAAAVLFVWLAATVPTNRLFFLGGSSLALYVLALDAGAGTALLAAAAAGLLTAFLLPAGPWTLAFLGFFAPYPVVKYGIERVPVRPLAWVLKLLVFNACLGLPLAALPQALPGVVGGWRWPPWGGEAVPPAGTGGAALPAALPVLVAANLSFLVYDWALSYFGRYWTVRFGSRRGRG